MVGRPEDVVPRFLEGTSEVISGAYDEGVSDAPNGAIIRIVRSSWQSVVEDLRSRWIPEMVPLF
jgi:hypothetical protein